MKKILFTLLLLQTIAQPLLAQTWVEDGAKWYYSFDLFSTTGYVEIEYIGDTTIYCDEILKPYQDCKVLNKTFYTYDFLGGIYDTVNLGHEYTWANSDTVFLYKHDRFYVLYDFSATIGDTWIVPENQEMMNCDTVGYLKVVAKGDTIINSVPLRYVIVEPEGGSNWIIQGIIIEKIGPINWYMFPEQNCITDFQEGGPLRCYFDNNFAFNSGIEEYCDYIVNNKENTFEGEVSVYPNPATSFFHIVGEKLSGVEVYIFDIFGRIIFSSKISGRELQIDVSQFHTGTYLLYLNDHEISYKPKKIQIINN